MQIWYSPTHVPIRRNVPLKAVNWSMNGKVTKDEKGAWKVVADAVTFDKASVDVRGPVEFNFVVLSGWWPANLIDPALHPKKE